MIPEPDEATKRRRREAVEREYEQHQRNVREAQGSSRFWWWLIVLFVTVVVRAALRALVH